MLPVFLKDSAPVRVLVLTAMAAAMIICGCSNRADVVREKESLLETDRAFSRLSEEKGVSEAFDSYMTDDATMFRQRFHPFAGRKTIRNLLAQSSDGMLLWEPYFAEVSASADLGYTLRTIYVYNRS